jgi:hypothetical protein
MQSSHSDELVSLSFDTLAKVSGGAEKEAKGGIEVDTSGKVKGDFSTSSKSTKYDKCIDTVKEACKAANPGTIPFTSSAKAGECVLSNMDRCKEF